LHLQCVLSRRFNSDIVIEAAYSMETIGQSFSSLTFLLLISALAVFVVYRLFHRLRTAPTTPGRLEVDIQELGGFSYRQLVLISLLSLFVEMLMIRWVSSEIRIFAYFKNFVLVACFLGFGLGCYLCRRRVQLMAMVTPLLLLTLILKAPISPLRRSISALPALLGATVEVHVWGVPALPTSWTGMLLALCFVVPVFALIATTFIPIGQFVGWYLENSPRGVAAYSVNVLASLAGIAAFLAVLPSSAAVGLVSGGRVNLRPDVLAKSACAECTRRNFPGVRLPSRNSGHSQREDVLVAVPEADSAAALRQRANCCLSAEHERRLVPADSQFLA
jgi:hypothetical protein